MVVVVPGLVHVNRYKLVEWLHEPTEKRICASLNARKDSWSVRVPTDSTEVECKNGTHDVRLGAFTSLGIL